MLRIVATLLLFASSGWGAEEVVVPDRFLGEWSVRPESCASGSDDMRISIGRAEISYWESDGLILAAVVRGNNLALIAELSAEGETWLRTAQFEIAPDGKTLTESESVPGEKVVRQKCFGAG